MATNKRDLKAYSRFDGTGRIVPGSTVLRRNKPKNGNWKETQAYECCNPPSDCPVGPFTFSRVNNDPFGTGSFIKMNFGCLTNEILFNGTQGFLQKELQTPVIGEPTLSEMVDIINTNLVSEGIFAFIVEGNIQVTVSNTDYISTGCIGSTLNYLVEIFTPG